MLALLKNKQSGQILQTELLISYTSRGISTHQIAVFPEADLGTKASIQLPRSGLLLQKIGDSHVFHVDTI